MHIRFKICLVMAATLFVFNLCLAAEQSPPANIGLDININNLPATDLEISNKVRSNLSEWGYSLPASGAYSHLLHAIVGKTSHQATPVGFSFSAGNSDPRASEFQKADVIPISCSLTNAINSTVVSEWQSTFSVNTDTSITSEKLIDAISTVCLETINRARLTKQATMENQAPLQPKWLPGVSVVVKDAESDRQTNTATEADKKNESEQKKEIIIQNQGSPLTIKFGQDRQ